MTQLLKMHSRMHAYPGIQWL